MAARAAWGLRGGELTYERLRPALLAPGGVNAGDLETVLVSLRDPEFAFSGPTLWTAWGRADP